MTAATKLGATEQPGAHTASAAAGRPASLLASMVLHLLSATGLMGLAVFHAFAAEGYDPNVGPLIHGIGIVGMASLLAAALVILGLRGTDGSRRGRLVATVLLALSPTLLLAHSVLLIAVIPALAALVLLWTPSSTTFIRTSEQQGENQVRELLDSNAVDSRVPYSNLGQHFNQPPGF